MLRNKIEIIVSCYLYVCYFDESCICHYEYIPVIYWTDLVTHWSNELNTGEALSFMITATQTATSHDTLPTVCCGVTALATKVINNNTHLMALRTTLPG